MRLMGSGGKAGLVMTKCISSYSISQSIEFEFTVGNLNYSGLATDSSNSLHSEKILAPCPSFSHFGVLSPDRCTA